MKATGLLTHGIQRWASTIPFVRVKSQFEPLLRRIGEALRDSACDAAVGPTLDMIEAASDYEARATLIRNFVRHPTEETVGHAELVWHYEKPNALYPLFETKINKPVNQPFVSHVSFWYDKHQWHFEVNVRKVQT